MGRSPAALRFTHLTLGNWRNFTSVAVDLQRRVFLVGPNASGKSNFLDVFRFLRDVAAVGGGFQEAIRRRGGVSAVRSLAARGQPEVVIKTTIGTDEDPRQWQYEIHFTLDRQKRPILTKEVVNKDSKTIVTRPDLEDEKDPERLTQTHLEQVNVNREFREVVEFFASIQYYHIVPQLVREPERSAGIRNDPYGGDFLERVAKTHKQTQQARLRRITRALQVAVPQLKELEQSRDERGRAHLRGKYEHWRHRGAWQSEEQFSDGTLRLMGLLWSLLSPGGPLLLEEPELSLHPDVVRYIPQMFHRMQQRSGRQVLVSTHSPDLLRDSGIGLDEVLLLIPEGEGTSVRRATEFEQIRALLAGGVSLAEAVIPRTRPKRAEQLPLFADL